MASKKCLIIPTSYDDLLESFDQLKKFFKTELSYDIEELKNLSENDIDTKFFLDQYDYFLIIISNRFSLNVDINRYFQVLEDIQKSGKRYWCVCDQKTIYARTMLRDLKILTSYLNCLPYPTPDIINLIEVYHVMTKENISDPEDRFGNWVHPYRTTEELTEYFFTQVAYLHE
jgi:hypothetical protein